MIISRLINRVCCLLQFVLIVYSISEQSISVVFDKVFNKKSKFMFSFSISISSKRYKFVIALTYFSSRSTLLRTVDNSSSTSCWETNPLGINDNNIVVCPFSIVKGVRKSCEKAAFNLLCSVNCRIIFWLFWYKQFFIFSNARHSLPISSL